MSDFAIVIKITGGVDGKSSDILHKTKSVLKDNGFVEFLEYGQFDHLLNLSDSLAIVLLESEFMDSDSEGPEFYEEIKDMFFEDAEELAKLLKDNYSEFEFSAEMIFW